MRLAIGIRDIVQAAKWAWYGDLLGGTWTRNILHAAGLLVLAIASTLTLATRWSL